MESAPDVGNEIYSELNKLRGMVRKQPGKKYVDIPRMTSNYYLYPAPQDVLIEEIDWNQTNTSYNGDAIYEWNLDDLSERQLSVLVHRILMYSTIAKATASIKNSRNSTKGVDNLGRALPANIEDAVNTLMLTIIEHFGSRFTNQYENTRTLLNALKDKSLGLADEFHDQVYGLLYTSSSESDYNCDSESENDVELPESSNSDHANICTDYNGDTFFDEKLREKILNFSTKKFADSAPGTSKTADSIHATRSADNDYYMPYSLTEDRNQHIVTLPYENDFCEDKIPTKSRPYQMNVELVEFYKKEIDNLLQKGLIKHYKSPWSCIASYVNNTAEKEQGMLRCGNLGHISPNCKLQKVKSLGLANEVHDQVYGLLYTSGLESDYNCDSESKNDVEFPESSDCDHTNICADCNGDTCVCEEAFYKLQSQFEDLDLNVQNITTDSVLEFLKEVSNEKLHEKIINFANKNSADRAPGTSNTADSIHVTRSADNDYYMPYSLVEFNRRLAICQLPNKEGPWTDSHENFVKRIKKRVKTLCYLMLDNPAWQKIIETDASNIGFGGILFLHYQGLKSHCSRSPQGDL
ncbi:uncharacterized protein LOC124897974 [Capsicum annuum]|uniref:uncharacterized protein LOC124897974 n=1 Tax=Capsicum annuum TaxID=4072 RepID=UPI001FB0E485|nr:uncharacterized protein LOC124897974 [Capsicum annuum]